MLKRIRRSIAFQKLRIDWKIKNKDNQTYPVSLFNIDRVSVGKGTYGPIKAISYECEDSRLIIGNYCSIGIDTLFLLGGEHNYKSISTYPFRELLMHKSVETISKGPIVVEDDVWICDKATILSDVHIGQGAVVAAGAVVTKDVPPYAIVGGVPAKVIKYRFEPEMIEELLKIDYSKLTKEDIEKHIDDLYTELKDPSQLDWMPKKG